jgi:hypothetical protein
MVSSTGHFAMFQAVTAAEPIPIRWPIRAARPPVTTTITADAASITTITMVMPRRNGIVFQNGRPSGMS